MKFAALFKGINVGGRNMVRMEELRTLLLNMGFLDVKTYIQSGNAVFDSALEEAQLQQMIYDEFKNHFGFESNVLIRNTKEIKALIENLPISSEEIASANAAEPKVEHLYIYFLDCAPKQDTIDQIVSQYEGPDILKTGVRELYLLCHQSIRKSRLAIHTSKVFDLATVRNIRTVNQLYDMLT